MHSPNGIGQRHNFLGAWWVVCIFALAAVLSYTDREILATLVALTNEHAFVASSAPGLSLRAVVTPAIAVSCILFFAAAARARNMQPVLA